MTRNPALDGLRGCAVLAVVGYHAGWLAGGWAGVNLFLALSGYLITSLLLAELRDTSTLDLARFYRRRLVRLVPACGLALLGLVLLTALVHPGQTGQVVAGTVVVLVYAANLVLTLYPVPQLGWAWSLSLEEQFYAVWPVTLLLAVRRGVSPRVVAAGAGAVATALVVIRLAIGAQHPLAAYATVRGDELLLGCVLAILSLRVAPAWGWPAAGVLGAVWCTSAPDAVGVTVAGLASVVLVGAVVSGFGRSLLASAPLRLLGRISYALYLWSCGLGAVLLGYPGNRVLVLWLGGSLLLAYLSTRYVEEPLRRAAALRVAQPGTPATASSVGGGS